MEASSSAPALPHQLELPAWKTTVSHAAAAFSAILFLITGVFKAVDPLKFAGLADNLLVPYSLTLPLAFVLAAAEITGAVLILVPRFRRWGAILLGGMLLIFMGYMGWNYTELVGRDCSCFPELRLPLGLTIDMSRSVGPGFFFGDAAFLAIAAIAGLWAKPSSGLKAALVILGSAAVFSGVSIGVAYAGQSGIQAPDSIVIEGQETSLQSGNFFLFFYDPECMHCDAAAKSMAPLKFRDDITVVAIPVRQQQWAEAFLQDTGLRAKTSLDSEKLREVFVFDFPPYGVYLENGREAGTIPHFEDGGTEHIDQMREMGIIE